MSNAPRALCVLSLLLAACGPGAGAQTTIPRFEQRLEELRTRSSIPAVTAVIAKGQQIVWSRSFGIADLATGRPATDTTVYHLASITKSIASAVILQLVEEGKLSLDDPLSKYGVTLEGPSPILVRHLFSHTSEAVPPGSSYRYNGNRFARLDTIVAQVTGMSFAQALQERVIAKLALGHTAPNPQSRSFAIAGHDRAAFEANMARGYTANEGRHTPTNYPPSFSVSAGLTASALDVAAFSMAMDRNALIKPESKALAWSPTVTPAGDTLPYGLGWFSTRYKGVRVVWQYGLWNAISSLILKVPERELTFVILGNTDGLSAPYRLGGGDISGSPWAREFLDRFVIGAEALPSGRLGASSEGAVQRLASGAWGAGPHGSIEEWEGLVVAWFDQSFAADSKLVLVDGEDRLTGIRKAQAAKGGAMRFALGSAVDHCKYAVRHICVAPGEAVLRFAPLRRQQWSGSEERWGTAVTVVLLEDGKPVSRTTSVQLEGKLQGPIRVLSAWTRSH